MEVAVVESTEPTKESNKTISIEENTSVKTNQITNSLVTEDTANQQEHVESIRKRYGIGIELNEQSKSVTESLKGVIGRSLESLSHELYNKG
jgi:hypothetical protein